MGANYYTAIWEELIPIIMLALPAALENGKTGSWSLDPNRFYSAGDRESYTFTVSYKDGISRRNGTAPGRDLQEILNSYLPFKQFAKGKIIDFHLDSRFNFSLCCREI